MLLTRLHGREPSYAPDDALRALSQLDWTGASGRPGVVAYFPVVRNNPYQELLYGGLPEVGLRPVATYDLDRTRRVVEALSGSGADVVVHVHWLYDVLAKVSDEAAGRAAIKDFLDGLRHLRDRGARLVWTVHNILPHEARFPELEAELRSEVVALVERVHVMSPATPDLVRPWFEVPEAKVMSVPHPSYHGVYASWMGREQARQALGIPPDTLVHLMIGRVKPYKGLTELLVAFDRLAGEQPGRHLLVVAGPADREPETLAFGEAALDHPAVLAALRRIPDQDLQVYLRAADVALFPYRQSLNSGAMALALTFGLPVVVPAHSGESANVDPSFAVTYDAEDPDGLLRALHEVPRLLDPAARAAATAAGEAVAAPVVARTFAARVRELLGSPVPASMGASS